MTKADTSLVIILGVLLAVVLGVVIGGIRPLYSRYRALEEEQRTVEEELAAATERAATLERLSQNREEIEDLSRRARVYLPQDIAAAPFLMDVEAMSRAIGIGIPTVSFQTLPARGGSVTEHQVSLTADGNFDRLKRLLEALENNLRFITLSTISLSIREEDLSLQVTGSIFSKADTKPRDDSLTISEATKEVLLGRQPFGPAVPTAGPGRPDPFANP